MEAYKSQEGCGFILKFPFVTNSKIISITSEKTGTFIDQIISKLVSLNTDSYDIYPYVMLQPCMKNRKVFIFDLFLFVCF